MGGCRGAIYSKRRTHDQGRVRGICWPGNVSGFMYNVDTAELHVDPDIDVGESAVYSFFSVLRSRWPT